MSGTDNQDFNLKGSILGAPLSTAAQPQVFPDTFEDSDNEDQQSHGLTLLPTAVDSDDDEEGEEQLNSINESLDALLLRKNTSEFGEFANGLVVNDPETGEPTLQTTKTEVDAVEEGRQVANLVKYNDINRKYRDRAAMAVLDSTVMFSGEERVDAYQRAIEQKEKYEEEVSKGKRQKYQHDRVQAEAEEQLPNPIATASTSTTSKRTYQPRASEYELPPEHGEYMSSRTSKGKRLYFTVRSEEDLDEQMERLAKTRDKDRMGSSQINRVVADIECELDTEAALRDSRGGGEQERVLTDTGKLWVDKYRARGFLDLVSDERTNRAVLLWLKEWEYCVFGKPSTSQSDDKWKRPWRRILMLSGPPGLGKTTLAHVAAQHAGYSVVEINASDDRTASRVRDRVLGVTQTQGVGADGRPQLLIIDEIDGISNVGSGAGQGDFVSMLVRLALSTGAKSKPLLRPIICICNNVYAPALRPLRQISQCFHVSPPAPTKLSRRLQDVCVAENVDVDLWHLVDLAKHSEGDIRACLNSLQLSKRAQDKNTSGRKDVQRSLFAIWAMIFTKPHQNPALPGAKRDSAGRNRIATGEMEKAYAQMILDSVRGSGEHERIMQGCFENYLKMEFRDLTHTKVSDLCADWLVFSDLVDSKCRRVPVQAETIGGYMDYALLAVHRTCSTPIGLGRGDFEYPHAEYECYQARMAATNIMQELISNCRCPRTRSQISPTILSLGVLDQLLYILSPTLVTSNRHLLKGAERDRMYRLLEVMYEWGVSLMQGKDQMSGQFVYRLEPAIDRLFGFKEQRPQRSVLTMRYAVRQLVAQELEQMKTVVNQNDREKENYLNRLFKEPAVNGVAAEATEEVKVKDFFGRAVTKSNQPTISQPVRQTAPKAWFQFFEGFSNAVRKPTQVKELL